MSLCQYAGFSDAVRERLPIDEPLSTFIYAALALALFFYRHRREQMSRAAAIARAEAASMQRLALSLLAVRDLTNTPLQTLRISVEHIAKGHPELAHQVHRMQRALDRLAELEHLLAPYEAAIDWKETVPLLFTQNWL